MRPGIEMQNDVHIFGLKVQTEAGLQAGQHVTHELVLLRIAIAQNIDAEIAVSCGRGMNVGDADQRAKQTVDA